MSSTLCLFPIIKALVVATSFLNYDPSCLHPVNEQQTFFLQEYYSKREELNFFNNKEIRSWASQYHQELNEILKKEGFSITLEPIRDGFGVVSVLDVVVEWFTKGDRTVIYSECNGERKQYPAVSMTENFEVYLAATHNHPIAVLKTKSSDLVYMTIADEKLKGFALQKRIDEIHKSMHLQDGYRCLMFPMVDLDIKEDITWLLDMKFPEGYRITQALQQTKFKMNEIGARVKSAVAIAVERGFVEQRLVSIDQPFYLWIKRPGVSLPVLAAYIDHNQWKDPLNLAL